MFLLMIASFIFGFRIASLRYGKVPEEVELAVVPGLNDGLKTPYLPWGVLWFLINTPLHRLRFPMISAGKSWMLWLAIVDCFSFYLLIGYPILFVLYALASNVFWRRGQYNIPVLWLTVLGLFSWWFLVFAVLTKLPVGRSLNIWRMVFFSTRNSPQGEGSFRKHSNWKYYGTLAVFLLMVTVTILL